MKPELYNENFLLLNTQTNMTQTNTYFFENLNMKFFKPVINKAPVVNRPILHADSSGMMNSVDAACTIWYKDSFILDMRLKLHGNNSVFEAEMPVIDEDINWCINSSHDSFIFILTASHQFMLFSAYFHLMISFLIFSIPCAIYIIKS